MARLNVNVGGDINYIFAGNERLFITETFAEFDLNQFLFKKFGERVNGEKRALISFETDGKERKMIFIGPRSEMDRIKNHNKGDSRKFVKKIISENGLNQTNEKLSKVTENDELSMFEDALGLNNDQEDCSNSSSVKKESLVDEIIYNPRLIDRISVSIATRELKNWINAYPEYVFLIDAELFESLNSEDYPWIESLLNGLLNRRWINNKRAEVAVVFKKYSTYEEWRDAIEHKTRDNVDAHSPILKDIENLQNRLTIKMPNVSDIRNLIFKRLIENAPEQLYQTDLYTEIFNQAISESSITGCRMLIDVDNVMRAVIGSGDYTKENLKNKLSIDSIRKKMNWNDMEGSSIVNIKSQFKSIKDNLELFRKNKDNFSTGADLTFCHRTDYISKIKPPASQHFLLIGEPGTGKTTLASILAKEYYDLGILASDRPVIVNLGERISSPGGPGWIATLFDVEGKDRLIFVDEIESTMRSALGDLNETEVRGGNEAIKSVLQLFITKLLSVTTDKKVDTIVCLAGYERGVNAFLAMDNGLPSRFPTKYVLKGYTGTVLFDIMRNYLRKEYGKELDCSNKEVNEIQNMFNKLQSGLQPRDIGSWANARTAETIADLLCKSNNNSILTINDFKKDTLRIQIGAHSYLLKDYIESDDDVLRKMEKCIGAKGLFDYFNKIERRINAGIILKNNNNIALKCDDDLVNLNEIAELSSKYLSSRHCISSSFYKIFDYPATNSSYQNMPTKLTDKEFDEAEGGILVFIRPSEHFTLMPHTHYLEQTEEILRRSLSLSNKSALMIIETKDGLEKLNRDFSKFAQLFSECEYKITKPERIFMLIKELENANIECDESFKTELLLKFSEECHVLKNIGDAIDSVLINKHQKNDRGLLILDKNDCNNFFEEMK